MDQPPAVPVSTGSMQEPGATHTRLSGRWLLLARVAWLSVAALGITLTTLSIPIFFAQVQRLRRDYFHRAVPGCHSGFDWAGDAPLLAQVR